MSAQPLASGTTPAGLGWRVGSAQPTSPEDVPTSWLPSPRARNAEAVAHAVLDGSVSSERLCAMVAELRRDLGVDHAQVSIISNRQIAVVVDGQLADLEADDDPDAPIVSSLENTLCVIVMRADQRVAIDDAPADDRVATTPPVACGRIGSYLGSPIRIAPAPPDDPGEVITTGVLCVYTARPHEWTRSEAEQLDRFAERIGAELQDIREAVSRMTTS